MADFTILVLPGAYATSVAATVDILRGAAALAPRVKAARPTWRVVSPAGSDVPLSGGVRIEASLLPKRIRPDGSTWIVPGLGIENPAALRAYLAEPASQVAIRCIAAHARHGGRVAASCSAVFLLQAAGVLANRRVTTSWWLASELGRLEPSCVVDADRMVCSDGPVSTAGAAFAQTDLMLHLLRDRFGVPLADAVGRFLLIDGRHAQAGFVVPTMLSSGNELVGRLVRRIESALPEAPCVEVLAAELAMSTRTLARHVHAATGRSTMALIQAVRLNRARMLIETSRMSVESIAEQVGYSDSTALRRMMRKTVGSTPSFYRVAAPPAASRMSDGPGAARQSGARQRGRRQPRRARV
jgi:transcriptional regulator GlxA family with amidase domain